MIVHSIEALGRAVAEHVPSPDLRRELWRILFEIGLQSDPTITTEGVIGFAQEMYRIARDADHARKCLAQEQAGELPEPRIPSTRWQDCIDRFKDALDNPALLSGDVAHLREALEDAVDTLTAARRKLERMDKSIFWIKGTPEDAVWSGSCPHQLERIDEVVGRLKGILC